MQTYACDSDLIKACYFTGGDGEEATSWKSNYGIYGILWRLPIMAA